MPTIIGEPPLAKDDCGRLKSRIGTVFPGTGTIVTLPGIHATQRQAYLDLLDAQRHAAGLAPLSPEERVAEWENAVDLVVEGETILIRPDPEKMPLAFRADELLQELVSKHKVKFLYVLNEKVHDAIKRRGECWRISPLPKSPGEMRQMIIRARIGIGAKEIYYFSPRTGTRLLTYHEFARLGVLDEDSLRRQLSEIKDYSARYNRLGCPEIGFFAADKSFSKRSLAACDFDSLRGEQLRRTYESLRQAFCEGVPPHLRIDDLEDIAWRNAMFAALLGQEDASVSEELLLGLSSEFFMQIEWLPGARIEEGELLFDSVFEEPVEDADQEQARQWVEKSRGFIFNLIREYGDLEYVNIGRVIGSLSYRAPYLGRRDVCIAEIKQRGTDREIVKIIRMQKWGVRERLDEGKCLLDAIVQSEEYTEYILDRRLGCRQLGMNLPPRAIARKLTERYFGTRRDYHGISIWTTYFERDYVHGIATDKMPNPRFADGEFALRFARLLGAAAAPNMIVGRTDPEDGHVVFDDGDEVVLEDEQGLPMEIVVADHTGTFTNYLQDLRRFAPEYAAPMNRRAAHVPNPQAFFQAYLEAFQERFSHIQEEYRKRKRAFDTLFKHLPRDVAGNFGHRWEQVLQRLRLADPGQLAELIRQNLVIP